MTRWRQRHGATTPDPPRHAGRREPGNSSHCIEAMTATQHTQSSAADEPSLTTIVYAARNAEALGLIDSLRDMIEDMPEPESDGINWGHAGSMGHVNKQLREILDFVEG